MLEEIEILTDQQIVKEVSDNTSKMRLQSHKDVVLGIGAILLGSRDQLSVKDILNLRIAMQIIAKLDIQTQLNCIHSLEERLKDD